jgi:Filamin/ABP280 repeat
VIQAYDSAGNPKTVGGDSFTVTINTTATQTVTDQQNGTYLVEYSILDDEQDTVQITVTLNNTNIQDSPFSVAIYRMQFLHSSLTSIFKFFFFSTTFSQ